MKPTQSGRASDGHLSDARKGISDIYPLTFMQDGLLFHSLQPGAAEEYIVQVSCKLSGIDPARWQKAWEAVSEHADILRTAFAWKNVSKPMQVIVDTVTLDWTTLDCADMSESEQEDALKNRIASDRARGFDLAKAPLHRMTLLEHGDGTFAFLWTYHHLILDAWSAAILMDWVVVAYSGADLPAAAPFKQYIRWVQKRGVGDSRRYWSEKLSSYIEPSSPPLLRRTTMDGLRKNMRDARLLSEAQTKQLTRTAQKGRYTVATLVQAAWALTLRDFSDREDIIFGWVVADRPAEIEGISSMAGLMINMVPVLVKCAGDVKVVDLVNTLQSESTASWEHGRLPLTDIHELAQLDPGEALFETVVVFENLPSFLDATEYGVKVEDRQAHWRTTYPISLMVAPGARMKSEIAYNAEQIEPDAISAMLARFEAHLINIGSNLDSRLSDIAIPTEHASELISENTLPAIKNLGEDILDRLNDRGEAIAIESGEAGVTSGRELVKLSQRLAQQLLEMDLTPGDIVATHLDRDVSQVVALLALLSIGCPFLPIDPCLPSTRKKYMLADSGAQLILGRISDGSDELDLPLAKLTATGELSGRMPEKCPAAKLPEGTAYVLYTSGSTGKPKGVIVSRTALGNLLSSFAVHPGLTADDRLLALTTISFDISLLELLGPLWAGATLIISPHNVLRDAEELASLIDTKAPTVIQATPVIWRMLVDAGWAGSPSLQAWCGGEALERSLADRLLQLVGSLWNLYGPTEATIWALVEEVKPYPDTAPISLGAPINGMQALVLDSNGNPTPVGGRGELFLSGIGLATGYHNQNEDVEAVFGNNPLGTGAYARLYRTGDIVHLMAAGRLRYLGRKDDQIKLRGMRLELLEVDAAIKSHPAVTAAASRLWICPDGDRELVGYVVCSEPVEMTELRAAIAEVLPPGAVPSNILQIEVLPLTPSGKINRQALPEPDWAAVSISPKVHRSHIGQIVAAIWENTLGVSGVGPDDGFFALGGHSIKVLAATMQTNKRLGTSMSLAQLFRAPKLADYVALVEENVAEGVGNERSMPRRRDRSIWHMLSPAQKRLWFVNRLDEDHRAYQLSCSLHLSGPLNVNALSKAITHLQYLHDALRTVFREKEGEPELFVLAEPVNQLEIFDATQKTCSELAQEPLPLDETPAARFVLLSKAPDQAELVFVVHHVLVDEWSLAILCGDLGLLYQNYVNGDVPEYPSSQLDFIDFLSTESDQASAVSQSKNLEYWLQELADVSSTTLPYDYPVSGAVDFEGGHHRIELSSSLCAHIGRVSRSHAVTPFTTLLTGIFASLHRYLASEDICLGVMDAGRTFAEMDRIVGPFSRALPVRLRIDETESVSTLMNRLQSKLVDASVHGDVPDISNQLKLPHWRRGNPFYNILVVMQNMPERPKAFGDIAVEVTAVDTGIAETDILIEIFAVDDGLALRFVYRRNSFSAQRIEDFAKRLNHVLLQVADDPSARVEEIDLLYEGEEKKVLVDWNMTEVAYPPNQTIQQLFELQVQRTPESIAVISDGESLSYKALNEKVNQLAHHLNDLGIGPDLLVGVFAERSLTLIIGLLGIVKAGGAYLPIDSNNNPKARLARILEDANPALLLTQKHLLESLPDHNLPALCLDVDWNILSQYPGSNPPEQATPEDLAYVVYTSGSTGVPKGVANTVGGLVNRLQWSRSQLMDSKPITGACKTNVGFVDGVTEILDCLLNGGKLVVLSREDVLSARTLLRRIEKHCVDYLVVVPSLLRELLDVSTSRKTPLKMVVSSGEILPRDLMRLFKEKWPHTKLVNFYGASELNGDSTFIECNAEIMDSNDDVIGRPISNTQAYILDDALKPVPVGMPGELYIGGVGLARGYLNQDVLTNERFIPHPFSDKAEAKLYRTGDLARYLPDGNIAYLGRLGSQIKLRGLSIEPGEIESALCAQPGVAQAVVMLRDDIFGDKRLVAYVVAKYGSTLNMLMIRKSIKQTLPDYMVPAAIVSLDSIPVNSNGKLDREALPVPDTNALAQAEYVEPHTQMEKLVAATWSEVLDIEYISIHDNFFDLGGHSLLVQKVAFLLSEVLGHEIPLKLFFEDIELGEFAAQLTETYGVSNVPCEAGDHPKGQPHEPASSTDKAVYLSSEDIS